VTWPWPSGPPDALYTGRMADPVDALARVDTDANEGFTATRAKNLAQMVLEYKERTQFAGQSVHAADPVDALYLPASHTVHGPPFGPVAPALQVQFVKAALPAGELEFDGQALHVEFAEAPTAVEYVPAPQYVHAADPVKALYLPGMHAAHVPPSGPEDPTLQVQFVKAALPTGELEFDGQALHVELAEAPTAVEYFPVPQAVHVVTDDEPLMTEYLPAAQAMQSDSASLLSVSRYLPARQFMHVVTDDEPLMPEYLPAAQAMQSDSASLLSVSRYLPARQFMHVVLDDEPLMTEYLPAAQAMQSDSASLLSVWRYLPARQFMHVVTDDEPLMLEYLPAAQEMQSDSASLLSVSRYFPGTQSMHVVTDDEPLMTEYLPAAQAMHVEFAVAPPGVEYFPAPQSVQTTDPVDVLYLPGIHAGHVPPSGPE
jgi:hypothetical protein